MEYTKLFARDVTLSLIEQAYQSESINFHNLFKDYLSTQSFNDIYAVAHGHNGYVEQYMSLSNSKIIRSSILTALENGVFFNKVEDVFSSSISLVKSFSADDVKKDDFYKLHENISDLWTSYFTLLYIADINDRRFIDSERQAKEMIVRNLDLFYFLDDYYKKFVINNYTGISRFNRYLTLNELLTDSVPSIQTLILRSKDYWFVDGDVLTINDMEPLTKKAIEHKYEIKILDPKIDNANNIIGLKASKGSIKGPARIVLSYDDVGDLLEGEILITSMTSPKFIPAMKRAAGYVTDEGGALTHVAIVARELGKPCVVATQVATKVFKNGDIVEVDADHGIVRKIR